LAIFSDHTFIPGPNQALHPFTHIPKLATQSRSGISDGCVTNFASAAKSVLSIFSYGVEVGSFHACACASNPYTIVLFNSRKGVCKEDTMKVVKIDEVSRETYLNPLFTSPEVARQVLLPDSKENVVNVVHFGKGVRNKFHTHDCEQILIITAGRGVVATEKEERVVTVGDIVLIPAGEKHWHGSNGESAFSHIFVSRKGSKMTQLED